MDYSKIEEVADERGSFFELLELLSLGRDESHSTYEDNELT